MEFRKRELRGYLLAEPDSAGHEEVETWLGEVDDETFGKLLAQVEDEIIDEYVWDELSAAEIAGFEANFLRNDERRRRLSFALSFARALADRVEADSARATRGAVEPRGRLLKFRPRVPAFIGRPVWGMAMAATLTLVTIGGVWSFVDGRRLERELSRVAMEQAALVEREATAQRLLVELQVRAEEIAGKLENERTRGAAMQSELESLRIAARRAAPGALSAIASIWLSPGQVRGGGQMERLILPPGDGLVRLLLDLGVDDYESYRASLHDADGEELWSQSKLAAQSIGDRVAVPVLLPTALLPRGDYSIRLSGATIGGGLELTGRYYLRAVRD